MTPEALKEKLEKLAPGTTADVMDLTGTMDHYQAVIVSQVFQGKRTLEKHRLVMDHMAAELQSGEVHALTIKAFTPEEYEKNFG